ncbi:MAG: cupin domain-containing protein [Lachnospiraceae bacterium]|nr:cupin domain-containing protein [Lachnospiraceae bacterium]
MSAPCHWHDGIEWIYIISGKICYYINGKRILLNENENKKPLPSPRAVSRAPGPAAEGGFCVQ